MLGHLILAAITIIALFISFLIIARTVNSTINTLGRLEYVLRKELELRMAQKEKHDARMKLVGRAAGSSSQAEAPAAADGSAG